MTEHLLHLPGIKVVSQQTRRLQMHLLASGPRDGEPVLLLHGNLAAATFWEETMLGLPSRYRAIAPDLRGYGLSEPGACIDATRGVADWVDDAAALADELGWDRFHLVAHSLGGCVAWALLALQPERIDSVTLVAPGPPCGFGGTRGKWGELNHEDGAGSGAGLVHPTFVAQLAAGERHRPTEPLSPRGVMNRLYWKPPFRPQREEELLTAMLQVHLGKEGFPGDWRSSPHWPGFAPGRHGPINAISPRYNQLVLPRLADTRNKPRLLWFFGADDPIICDRSPSDAGTQGRLGLRSGWPGSEVFPPQPLLTQVSHALDRYEHSGGSVQRFVLSGVGHSPHLERPKSFQSALVRHLDGR